MKWQSWNWLLRLLTLLGIALAAWLLYRTASQYTLAEITLSLRQVRPSKIVFCVACAAGSYICLTLNDWVGLRYVGRPLSYPKAALAAFVSLALGQSIGFAGLSSGAIRYRFYSRWGLGAQHVARLVLFCGLTVAAGLSSLAALVLLGAPALVAPALHLSIGLARLCGFGCAALVGGYLALAAVRRAQIRIRGWSLAMPRFSLALAQTLLGTVNYICVAGCLYAALSSGAAISYVQVVAAFVLGNTAALIIHAPGGLGTIETAVTYVVPHHGGSLGGGLVLFRLGYYLLPLVLGLIVLLLAELAFRAAPRRHGQPGHPQTRAGSIKPVPNTGDTGPSSVTVKGTSRR